MEVTEQETFAELIRDRARRQPEAAAVVASDNRRTWAELDARTGRMASVLRRLGVRKRDRVGILATNCPEWIEVFFGVHKAGAVAVPLNDRLTQAECTRLLEDADATALVAAPELSGRAGFRGPTLELGTSYETALAAAADEERADADPQPDDLAVIAYTSGTTGLPKGVMWSHRTLLSAARRTPFPAAVASGARILLCAPLCTGGGLIMACNVLAIGATLVLAEFTPQGVLQIMVDAGIELTGFVPTMIAMLADAAPPGWRAPALRRVCYGTGTMSPQLFARARGLFGCEFEQAYGMTETCTFGTRLEPADHAPETPQRLASAGKPMPGVTLKIVGESGAEVPRETAGEILIRSPGNMLGYWQRPEETRRALEGGWYHTADIGCLDREGYLHVLGRRDDMVKSGGFNVAPAEVEDILLTHPAVAEVVVIGLPDERWGQRVAAIVRKRPGAVLSELDLTAFCRGRLAGYKHPRTIVFTDVPFPRNAMGKVSRQALRAQYRAQRPG